MSNKGFSMVEILAVVVILGIVSTIGIITVSKLIDNSRIHYYETQEEQLVLAAQSYANDNKNILPKTVGEMRIITLKELKDNNYIKEEIVDQNKNKCYAEPHIVKDKSGNDIELEGSRVEVYKSNRTDYIYTGYLECDGCIKMGDTPTSCYTSKNKKEPNIIIDIPKVSSDSNLNASKVISISIEGSKDDSTIKVASYSYKIYVNNEIKKNSGLKINNRQNIININDNKLFNFVPGLLKVVVSATNSEGINKTIAVTKDLNDVLAPACGKVTYENANAMKNYDYKSPSDINCGTSDYSWLNIGNANATRQAWVLCNDEYKLGCAQHEFSANLVSDGENHDVLVKDRNGNNQTCTIKKCIDKSTPKLVVQIKSGDTVKQTYTVDAQSATQKYTKNDTYTTWLNKANYPNGVEVVATVEEPISKIKSFKWYQNAKNQKENAIGTISEKVKEFNTVSETDYESNGKFIQSQTITDDGVRKQVFTIVDKAGNSLEYTLILKIDRTPPSCKLKNAGTKSATSGYYYVNVPISFETKSDAMSGVKSYDITTSSTPSYDNHATASATTQGSKTYYGYVQDNAGNTSKDSTSFTATEKHTATFNGNGATASPASITQYWGDKLGTLPTVSRTHYKFLGWFTGQTNGDQISTNTTMPNRDVTYYAHWEALPVTYTVNFKFSNRYESISSGNDDTTKSCTAYGDGSCKITTPHIYFFGNKTSYCEKKYNDFFDRQWNTKSDGTGTAYKFDKEISISSNFTLNGIFKADPIYVNKNDAIKVGGWACNNTFTHKSCDMTGRDGDDPYNPIVWSNNLEDDTGTAINQEKYFKWDGKWKYSGGILYLHGKGTTSSGNTTVSGGACHNGTPELDDCVAGYVKAYYFDHEPFKCPNASYK